MAGHGIGKLYILSKLSRGNILSELGESKKETKYNDCVIQQKNMKV